ncbi:ROK family protein [Thalassotalea maritima]|uniref:ROK family protein n=1 Tax=Thalassotalea maritima TaxID=3242416 RepID=UPI0035288366
MEGHALSIQLDTEPLIYGLDIGGTKIEIGVFSQDLELQDKWRVPTPSTNYSKLLDVIVQLVSDANNKYLQQGLIGIGMPGILDSNNSVVSANVPCATGKNIVHDLENLLKANISIGNDCRLFALSESNGGAAKGFERCYGAIIGTGAAGGLCIGGKLYLGKNGFAGEYGHQQASAYLINKYNLPLWKCGCGLVGCYESYISGPGLGRIYHHFGSKSQDTRHFVKKLRENDSIANETFHCYMDILGASFASIVLSYDPDVIVVGGGISLIDEVIFKLEEAVNAHLFSGVYCPPIKRANFGDSSGIRGAAILRKQLVE